MYNILKLKKKFYLNKILKVSKSIFISSIGTIKFNSKNTLIFMSAKKNKLYTIKNKNVIILSDALPLKKKNGVIFCKKPRMVFCKILNYLIKNDLIEYKMIKEKISPKAKISAGATIEKNVQIGQNSVVENNVMIKSNSIIGNNCTIRSGAIIGGECFSFERENDKTYSFPYFGNVKIGNNVEIGNNTIINKSNFGSTKIGDNSKIDNLVQIAHNTSIGKNVTITSCVQIGGSVNIKDNVWICPSSSIMSGLTIRENVFIGIGSIVIKNIEKNIKVFGNPAREIKDENKKNK